MTGLRRLLREAGRASSLVRQLEREVALGRRAIEVAPCSLEAAGDRLATLTASADPFAVLEPFVVRLATAGGAEQPAMHRRLSNSGRLALHPSPSRQLGDSPSLNRGIATGRSGVRDERVVTSMLSRTIVASDDGEVPPHKAWAPATLTKTPRATSALAAGDATPSVDDGLASDPRASATRTINSQPQHRPFETRPVAAAQETFDASDRRNSGWPPGAGQPIDPDRARNLLTNRARAVNALAAFRSTVTFDAVTPQGPIVAGVSPDAVDSGEAIAVPVVSATASVAESGDAGMSRKTEPGDPTPLSVRYPGDQLALASRGEGVAASVSEVAPPGVTGLRRLAALATESIEPDADLPVEDMPVRDSVAQELDRLLRAELLHHGVDADGWIR